jgi:small nuclear ribonucleoprotein D3
MSISVPVKLLHEAENHVVSIELKSGETFRGYLITAEDNMNCLLDDVTITYNDGKTNKLDQIYLRGSQIRFIVIPDMLKNSPIFKKLKTKLNLLKILILLKEMLIERCLKVFFQEENNLLLLLIYNLLFY